jgi:hypothetical protein
MSVTNSKRKRTPYITSYFSKKDKSERFTDYNNQYPQNKIGKNISISSTSSSSSSSSSFNSNGLHILEINTNDTRAYYESSIIPITNMDHSPTDNIQEKKDMSDDTEIDILRRILNSTSCNDTEDACDSFDDDYESENKCIECNIDMGKMNPRQYCGKTHCLSINLF